jgi:hypothetical protein
VWSFSAGQCAFSEYPLRTLARETESVDAVVVGEVAHIHAYEDDSLCADLTPSLEVRKRYPNFVLLAAIITSSRQAASDLHDVAAMEAGHRKKMAVFTLQRATAYV